MAAPPCEAHASMAATKTQEEIAYTRAMEGDWNWGRGEESRGVGLCQGRDHESEPPRGITSSANLPELCSAAEAQSN